MMAREGPICSARVFRTMFGISSGPEALLGFRFFSNFVTPWDEIVMGLILVEGGGSFGSGVDEALVKTDLNWVRRISAFV